MKKLLSKIFGHDTRERLRQYWRSLVRSKKHVNMSEGAQEVNKVITSAHGDGWRRTDKKHR